MMQGEAHSPIHITAHAFQRIEERMGAPKDMVETLVRRALEEGLPVERFRGAFRRYLNGRLFHSVHQKMLVCGIYLFVFSDKDILITVIELPKQYMAWKRYLR